jgi:hypothetical protein
VQVTLPDGTVVLAQGRLGLVPSDRPRDPDFALYLDGRWEGDPEVTWPCRLVSWRDHGLPSDEAEVFAAAVDLHRRAGDGELVETACWGGLGRTGAVLACLAVLAGVAADDAVPWVRAHYEASAVETEAQCELVARFADWSKIG